MINLIGKHELPLQLELLILPFRDDTCIHHHLGYLFPARSWVGSSKLDQSPQLLVIVSQGLRLFASTLTCSTFQGVISCFFLPNRI